MRGRLRYILPDSAYLMRIVLTHHPLDAMILNMQYIKGSSALQILSLFSTLYNQTIGQCTDPLPAAWISRITFKSFNIVPSHTPLSITLLFAT